MRATQLESYPSSPLQQGMLFHHLLDPHAGVDIEQLVCMLPEAVDVGALRGAWERVLTRHDVLRTSFRWEDVPKPQQDVHPVVVLPFAAEDWRDADLDEIERRRRQFLREDRQRGFDLDRAPLLRVTLFRLADAQYELIWTFHHIILDGRSFPLVLQEVFSWYDALRRGEVLALDSPRPYRDYITWLGGIETARAAAFWRNQLRGFSAPTPLPRAFAVPDASTTDDRQGDRVRLLSAASTLALDRVARDAGVTVNTVVQGAWAILLARHAGESDVVFGATRACRRSSIPGAESMVGLFINTLPMRVVVDGDADLGSWLRDLRASWNALREHEHTPLNAVQAWSELPGGTPLFDSIVVFENYLLDSSLRDLGGAWADRRIRLYEQTNYAVTVAVYGGVELTIKLEYDRTRIDDSTAERVLGHLATLLEGMATGGGAQRVADVPWVAPEERSLVAVDWNRTGTSYERGATIPELFADQVRARPDALAVVYRDQALTYRELDVRADRMARQLQRLGIRDGVPVGLCVERSLDQIVAVLGILKAGGAYVALDASYPAERLAFMLADAGAPVVLARSHLLPVFQAISGGPIAVSLDEPLAADRAPAPTIRSGSDAESLAYLIYTSGSTGVPKAVEACHRGVIRLVRGSDYATFGPDEVVLSFAPLGFDASTFEIWGALLNGGQLVLFPEAEATLDRLGDVIRDNGVTTMWLTAALFHQMVERNIDGLRPLKQLLAGGDVLSVPHVRRVLRELPACQLINGYGPTENTTFTCCYAVPAGWGEGEGAQPGATVPIGRPVANTTVFILDGNLRLVPVGVAGRLYAGGDGLARGYHGRPELTAERFIATPFADQPGGRLYDTGDLAAWRPDGTIEFHGRADQQLKIRGFRVEPGEVEAVLATNPAVRDVAVIGREDSPGDKRLAAYVVPSGGGALDTEALRRFLAERLPAYLVPSHFVAVEALPLTASGKVDRQRLPLAVLAEPTGRETYVTPRTPTETIIAGIWAATLRADRVGVHDNFFELGGDSLLIIQIIARARDAGLTIAPRDFFRHPTIAELATTAAPSEPAGREQGVVTGAVAFTPAQRWFLDGERDELNYWNQAFLFTVLPAFDTGAFERALVGVVTHHDALRLRFHRDRGQWRQETGPSTDAMSVDSIDLSSTPDDLLAGAIEAACVGAQRSLNIERGPLLRLLHLTLGAHRPGRLLIVVHHLVVDGVSWRLLLEDLEIAYSAERRGEPVRLPPKTSSMKEWGERIDALGSGEILTNELPYWESTLRAGSRSLPRDYDRGGDDVEGDAATTTFALGTDETRALLQQMPKAYNTQVNDALLTALGLALAPWIGKGTLIVDGEGHGREDVFDGVDVSRTVGWFTSIFPVRLDFPFPANLGAALKRTKEQLRAVPHRGFGFGVLRNVAGERTLASDREVVFNYLGQLDALVAGSSLFAFAPESCGPWRGARARRRHRLEITALVLDGRLEVRWNYNRRTHREETIRQLGEAFLQAVRALITHCAAPGAGGYTPSDFPLAEIDQATLDRVAAGARDVEDIYPLAPIQGLFLGYTNPGTDDPGFEQWCYRIAGPLDTAALKLAWQRVVDRHSILRTTFASDDLERPLQVVHRHVALPWVEHDWRHVDPADHARRLDELRRANHARGFPADIAPLMRMALVRVAEEEYDLVWSYHHLLLDRWSWPIVLQEVRTLYADRTGDGDGLPPPVAFHDYMQWVAAQDIAAAEAFWRVTLDGFASPQAFRRRAAAPEAAPVELRLDLTTEQTGTLRSLAARWRLSVNIVVQGAWALWLAHEFAASDVVFGVAVSGRPADLAGVDRLVGPTINNLPMRARIDRDRPLGDWLGQLQADQAEMQHFAYPPLERIQSWSGVPWRRRLFETLLVFQTATADDDTRDWLGPKIRIERRHSPTQTRYPLSLSVAGSDQLSLRASSDAAYFLPEIIGRGIKHLRTLLLGMAAWPEARLGALLALLPESERGASTAADEPAGPAAEYVPPRTPAEAVVARIWGELLGRETVGVTENFFALGGHSLLALQMASRLRETFRMDVPLRALFASPSVEELTRALVALERRPGRVERIAELVQHVNAMSIDQVNAAAKLAAGPHGS